MLIEEYLDDEYPNPSPLIEFTCAIAEALIEQTARRGHHDSATAASAKSETLNPNPAIVERCQQ
jgi:hypothetical protein